MKNKSYFLYRRVCLRVLKKMIDVMCPSCKNVQKYNPSKNSRILSGKKKKCVFCNFTFSVSKNKTIKKQTSETLKFVPLRA